jgi:P pilus assembly chaperone PapD
MGIHAMRFAKLGLGLMVAASALTFAAPAVAAGAGDLLVAPTRIVLDGARGTEVILNNIGAETATYRISLELRRMTEAGELVEVEPDKANDKENAALAMISYAPRKVVLPPNQPQAIRIGIRAPEGLADGEYRAHMLFRAIPAPRPVSETATPVEGVSVSITPIYGVTIPVIVRKGNLTATAAISDAKVEKVEDGLQFSLAMTRTGTKSTYGRIRISKPGMDKPVFDARGVAVYAETGARRLIVPVDEALAAALKGPAKIEYLEDNDTGGGTIAAIDTVIR